MLKKAGVRRIQRVSDVNAMGYAAPVPVPAPAPASAPVPAQAPFVPNTFAVDANAANAFNYSSQPSQPYPSTTPQPQEPANYYDPYKTPTSFPQAQPQYPPMPSGPAIFDPNVGNAPQNTFATQFSMLQQPMVQDMALQYGQRLADHGKQLVETHIEKYVPVTRLKYYFAVDNNYVVRKLVLLLFPFTHKVSIRIVHAEHVR